jgi:RNA polymerase sigma-70 factor (ECF subfamily)
VQDAAVTQVSSAEVEFDALIGPHLEAGYRTALAMLRDPDEARDAVQESAMNAWRRFRQLRDEGSARAWFLAIVANECRSIRRSRRWSIVRLAQVDRPVPDVDVERTDLEIAVSRLPREDRLALFLYFYLDLPLEEVGAVLGLTANGAKTRIYRATRKLRPALELRDD